MSKQCIIILVLVAFFSCSNDCNKKMRIEYFKSWVSYSHPVKLINQIDSSHVENLDAYYVGKFEGDRLMEVTKYLNDTVQYKFEYEYDSEGNFIRKK